MAERLTRNNKVNFCFHDEASNMVYYKLQDLEDIMEKYGIESVEELECFLDDYSKNQGRYFAICEEMDDLKKDRDTWKRACELACEELDHVDNYSSKTYTMPDEQKVEYFYQQAKKGR